MKHIRAQKLYPAFVDGLLSQSVRDSLVQHLAACDRCRKAYELLDRTMSPRSNPGARLSMDPYLPTRIRAIVAARRPSTGTTWVPALRWSLGSLAVTLALALGIYLGQDLSRSGRQASADDPVSEFAVSLSGSDLSDGWMSAVGQNGEGQQ